MVRNYFYPLKYRISAFAILLAILLSFVACDTTDNQGQIPDGDDTLPEVMQFCSINDEYKIIYEADSTRCRSLAGYVQNSLSKNHGVELRMRKDTTESEAQKEILIGNTTRDLSDVLKPDIGSGGWSVRVVGDRIAIEGATSTALREACEYFVSSVEESKDGLRFMHEKTKFEKKTDLLAAENVTLKVASFNIKNGSGVGHDMSKLAELIIPLELDIVGLQEVDIGTRRAGGLDTLKLLAEAAGFPYYAFAPSIDFQGGQYGTAIMSKYPIASFETVKLTTPDGLEQRAYGHAVIEIGEARLDFYNTHLSHENKDVRISQLGELDAETADKHGFILTADFNTSVVEERELISRGTLVNTDKYATFPSKNSSIDDIIVHDLWDILDSGMLEVGDMSDHNLLWAELHFVG